MLGEFSDERNTMFGEFLAEPNTMLGEILAELNTMLGLFFGRTAEHNIGGHFLTNFEFFYEFWIRAFRVRLKVTCWVAFGSLFWGVGGGSPGGGEVPERNAREFVAKLNIMLGEFLAELNTTHRWEFLDELNTILGEF